MEENKQKGIDLSKIELSKLDSMYINLVHDKSENPLKDKIKIEIERRVNSVKEARERK